MELLKSIAPFWFDCGGAKFQLKPLTGMQQMQVEVTMEWSDGQPVITGKCAEMLVKFGVIGWEDVTGADGKAVDFSPDSMNMLPSRILGDLAVEVYRSSKLGPGPEKNS